MKRKYKFPRRNYVANHSNEKCEIDIAIMKEVKPGFIGFLLAIDIFNSFIYTFVLKKKDRKNLETALTDLIRQSDGGFEVITADMEFQHYVTFLEEKDVCLKIKGRGQHCHLAELKIQTVKRRIYQTMRASKTKDWDQMIGKITSHVNDSPTKLIGYLRPSHVRGSDGDSIVIGRLKELNLFKVPSIYYVITFRKEGFIRSQILL